MTNVPLVNNRASRSDLSIVRGRRRLGVNNVGLPGFARARAERSQLRALDEKLTICETTEGEAPSMSVRMSTRWK